MENNIPEKYIVLIDQYLDGKLSADGLQEFKKVINSDSALKNSVQEYIDARVNIRIQGEQEQKKRFEAMFDTATNEASPPVAIDHKPKRKRLPIWQVMSIAGVFIGFLIFFLFPFESATENFQLDQYIYDPAVTLLRATGNNANSEEWEIAVQSFAQKNYDTALMQLKALEADTATYGQHAGKLALYQGVCQLRLDALDEALKTFEKIQTNNPFYDQKLWYEALTLLKKQDTDGAIKQLEKITQMSVHYKRAEAQNILDHIKD